MRVLVVCKYKNHLSEHAAPFVVEQMHALQAAGVECRLFIVRGKGMMDYLRQLKPLKKAIVEFHPDVIHAHYGFCGLLANMQRATPVVTTYHGSDINSRPSFVLSRMAMHRSAWNVFVSRQTMEKAKPKKCFSLLPCGVDLNDLQQTGKIEARQRMGLDERKRYVLFAGAFDNAVKDPSLAKQVVALLEDDPVLLELKGYAREQVILLMCAADALLMTSVSEGSPQVIKEALACGCPIVSVDVGDVRERIEGVGGCYVDQTRETKEIASLLEKAFSFKGKTEGRKKIVDDGLDNRQVADHIKKLYITILNK